MNKLQWALIASAAILIWLNSAFPPRHYGGQPNNPASRAFILSDDFDKTDIRPLKPDESGSGLKVKRSS